MSRKTAPPQHTWQGERVCVCAGSCKKNASLLSAPPAFLFVLQCARLYQNPSQNRHTVTGCRNDGLFLAFLQDRRQHARAPSVRGHTAVVLFDNTQQHLPVLSKLAAVDVTHHHTLLHSTSPAPAWPPAPIICRTYQPTSVRIRWLTG